jgi:hypothetical protein
MGASQRPGTSAGDDSDIEVLGESRRSRPHQVISVDDDNDSIMVPSDAEYTDNNSNEVNDSLFVDAQQANRENTNPTFDNEEFGNDMLQRLNESIPPEARYFERSPGLFREQSRAGSDPRRSTSLDMEYIEDFGKGLYKSERGESTVSSSSRQPHDRSSTLLRDVFASPFAGVDEDGDADDEESFPPNSSPRSSGWASKRESDEDISGPGSKRPRHGL